MVESIWNRKQMTMPFWEPIPYIVQLMHCKKLKAQKPTENPLKPINSKYCLLKEFFKAYVRFYTCSHLCCDVLFALSFSCVCAHTLLCCFSRYILYLPCIYLFVSFKSHSLHLSRKKIIYFCHFQSLEDSETQIQDRDLKSFLSTTSVFLSRDFILNHSLCI